MTLEEVEKLARDAVESKYGPSYDRSLDLARAMLAVLPVVRAAEAAQSPCVDYGYCEQCGDHCGNCTAYGDHRDNCDANPKRLTDALDTMRATLAKGTP